MYKHPRVWYMSCSRDSLSQRPFERPRKNGHRYPWWIESILPAHAFGRRRHTPQTRATACHVWTWCWKVRSVTLTKYCLSDRLELDWTFLRWLSIRAHGSMALVGHDWQPTYQAVDGGDQGRMRLVGTTQKA